MFGLLPEDYPPDPPFEVWPEHADAVNTFVAMGTQWRVGPAGAYGLDYSALSTVWPLVGVPARRRARVFNELRTLEDAALEQMRRDAKQP